MKPPASHFFTIAAFKEIQNSNFRDLQRLIIIVSLSPPPSEIKAGASALILMKNKNPGWMRFLLFKQKYENSVGHLLRIFIPEKKVA